MKIFLIDLSRNMCKAWSEYPFGEYVEIVCAEFSEFMDEHREVDGIVSPANSFGLMDGGYDAAITGYFGEGLMKKVQDVILREYKGFQPVGSAITVDIDETKKLIHVPSMMYPSPMLDIRLIYQCMRVTLSAAENSGIKELLIPAFGRATGRVPDKLVAAMMWLAYKHHNDPPRKLDWDYVAAEYLAEFEKL